LQNAPDHRQELVSFNFQPWKDLAQDRQVTPAQRLLVARAALPGIGQAAARPG
jgi:hypothetical protein